VCCAETVVGSSLPFISSRPHHQDCFRPHGCIRKPVVSLPLLLALSACSSPLPDCCIFRDLHWRIAHEASRLSCTRALRSLVLHIRMYTVWPFPFLFPLPSPVFTCNEQSLVMSWRHRARWKRSADDKGCPSLPCAAAGRQDMLLKGKPAARPSMVFS